MDILLCVEVQTRRTQLEKALGELGSDEQHA
jgi:hypothetical protein